MKICKKCGGTEFYKSGRCKPCRKAEAKKWRDDHPEHARETHARWYADNSEHVKAKAKKWDKANPARVNARSIAWVRANPEKRKAVNSKWAKDNPAYCMAQVRKRQSKKKNAIPGWFSQLDELIIQEAYALAKLREKTTGFKWHVDHKVPLQSKIVCGFHIGCNIQVIPASVNMTKGNRHWENMP